MADLGRDHGQRQRRHRHAIFDQRLSFLARGLTVYLTFGRVPVVDGTRFGREAWADMF